VHVRGGRAIDEDRKERSLRVLVDATERYQKQLTQSIQDQENGWHRLNVKLENGMVVAAQIQRDQQLLVD